MRICGVSDLHGNLDFKLPKCDVLCICGDIVELSVQRDLEESRKWFIDTFFPWVESLPCEKVIITPGNHDFFLENMYEGEQPDFDVPDKLKILIDELYVYKDVRFYGTPWINPIHWQKWAFELSAYEECPYKNIPECNILLTHENPNYNEVLEYYCFGKYMHHFFGHWHDGISYGYLNQHNCSILTDSYSERKNLKIVTVDLDTSNINYNEYNHPSWDDILTNIVSIKSDNISNDISISEDIKNKYFIGACENTIAA